MSIFTTNKKVRLALLFVVIVSFITNAKSQNLKINPILRQSIEKPILTPVNDSIKNKNVSRFLITPSTKAASANNTSVPTANTFDCIIYTKNGNSLKTEGYNVRSVLPGFVTASLTAEQIAALSKRQDIKYIDIPRKTKINNDMSTAMSGAKLLHDGKLNNTVYKGKGTIVAVFDTGIDWKHPDFREPSDSNTSRILCIWDMTLTPNSTEQNAPGFDYGVYYTKDQISAELVSKAGKIRETDNNGHGTHVAGTAAGNGSGGKYKQYEGFAPEADIVVIKGGNGSFSTDNEIDAILFLKHLADSLQRPIVLNMSLGGQFSAHDGTDAADQAVDYFTSSGNGRAVVIAAGNDNGSYLHNRLTLAANGKASMTFTIDSGGINNTDYVFDYLLYLNNNNDISAVVTDPLGTNSDTVTMGNLIASHLDTNKSIRIQMVADNDPANNNTYLELYMDRDSVTKKNPNGVWTLTLINDTDNAATVDGWLDGTGNSGQFEGTELSGGDNDYLVGSPGDATTAITAASYNTKVSWVGEDGSTLAYYDTIDSISSFSSHGPRRDGVMKPELTAPGEGIVSSRSSAATASDPISKYYMLDQGTSMATPAITGAVALLFQANPAASATDIKSLLTSNVNKDYTPASLSFPNNIWGYGKLDVYKAAAAIFNSTSQQRKLYKYDKSTSLASSSTGDAATYVNNNRIAVRFTPDITGKLAGAYFQSHLYIAPLIVEIRSSKNNKPDSLLGSAHVDSAALAELTMNYINLDSLNIRVTSGQDYFIEMYIDTLAPSGSKWVIFYNTQNPAGRSVLSSDNGQTWNNASYNYKIRSDVYSDGLTDNIATYTSDSTHDINTSEQFRNANNELIAQISPNGASPVTGNITAKVWLESATPVYDNDYYLSRHYQITPAVNSTTATARVTLYFKQSEFDAFNTTNPAGLALPANPTDSAGIHNLLIGKYSGTSSDGSGKPGTYSAKESIIDPDDKNIVWNAGASRWEISFDVEGFSGFVVQTKNSALPIILDYFNGNIQGKSNVLKWKAATATGNVTFELQRSKENDFSSFETIDTENPSSVTSLNPFNYTDDSPQQGNNYYRLKVIESPGGIFYSDIINLPHGNTTSLYPNVINKSTNVYVNFGGEKGAIVIVDAVGRRVYSQNLVGGLQSLLLPKLVPGIYFYTIQNAGNKDITGKIIVQ
ncbi:MAG: S8 family peptidase [Arachidicoccus sp.]|nr:S8 family peptidase [Arachidicoccus sp.]